MKRLATPLSLLLLVEILIAAALSTNAVQALFIDTASVPSNTFTAVPCFPTPPSITAYNFAGITSPSSTHAAEDGEIDVVPSVIIDGTFAARRGTGIDGWDNWGEASTAEYGNLVGSDDARYQGADPDVGDNAAMIFEFTIAEDPTCITSINVEVEAAQGAAVDALFVYLWNYSTGSYLVGGSMSGTTDAVVSFGVTSNPGDYVQASDGQLTVFVANLDTSDWIRVDDIEITIACNP